MSHHLSPVLLDALSDGELSPEQLDAVNEHLGQCLSCTSSALSNSLLKSATAKAGRRYDPSQQFKERITRLAQQENADSSVWQAPQLPRLLARTGFAGWAVACALLLILGTALLFERNSQRDSTAASNFAGVVTEACDQHVSTLAANEPPQVLSSDRHTVKPWFQGKLPFSFNLPENLPQDTKLEGANLTYLRNEPAALLLFSIGKHRVSVFVQQSSGEKSTRLMSAEHAGFHAIGFDNDELEMIAVSDVDSARLSALISALRQVQAGQQKPPG
jgi:anti-sigma factor RsiW